MNNHSRRSFLKFTGLFSASALTGGWTQRLSARSANEQIVVGVIGCGPQGRGLVGAMADAADVAYVCDPDEARCRQAQQVGRAKQAVADLRRVLDDKSVDAVVIATPDHWHAPAAIMACEAGKHVYVEKPMSHNLREGRLLLNAARRNNVVVQHGTHSRSNRAIVDAVQMLREGMIGEVLAAKAWNVQRRESIGHAAPSNPPPGLDYDLWVGPAEFMPYQENRLHYGWRWWHNFGTGDIGNDGMHEIDLARWGLGVTGLPDNVVGMGGKYFFEDDQQFPDTASCAFEWLGDGSVGARRQLQFEMRLWSTNYPHNVDSGVEFYGTQGTLFASKRGKLQVFGERNKRIEHAKPAQPPTLVGAHHEDFLDAIRTGRRPNADVEIGHHSASLVHLANIAIRVGRALKVDPQAEQIQNDGEANRLLTRTYRDGGHWAIPSSM